MSVDKGIFRRHRQNQRAGREQHDWNVAGAIVGLQHAADVPPGHVGQPHVEHDDIGHRVERTGNPGAAVIRNFTRTERFQALADFYRSFQGGRYLNGFLNEVGYARRGGFLPR